MPHTLRKLNLFYELKKQMAEKMSGYCYVYLDSGSHTNALVNGGALRRPAEAKGRSVFDQLVMGRTLLLAETTLRAKRASHRFRMQQKECVLEGLAYCRQIK